MLMFKYECWYKDAIYGDICKATGRITAKTSAEARITVHAFYENVQHITITPILIEDKLDYDKEWDI